VSVLTHKVRIVVRTKRQREALTLPLVVSQQLYNAALEERSSAWAKSRKRIGLNDQMKSITTLKGDPSLANLPVNLLRWPLKKLDKAFKGFFDRVKKGQTPGYPRYKSKDRWDTFGYTDRKCWSVDVERNRLDLRTLGWFRLRPHRPIDGEIRSLQIKREGRKWFALISVRVDDATNHANDNSVGLDMGTTHLATLSTGERIVNVRTSRRLAPKVAEAQRALARAKRGSTRRRHVKAKLLALRCHEANSRATHLHQQSALLVRLFALIIIEDLTIRNMMRSAKGTVEAPGTNVAQKTGLNRSIGDAAWGCLADLLTYKAARAGGSVIRVDPRNTSNECSRCHAVTPSRIGDLFSCRKCGLTMDRDHNAALVIEYRGVVAPLAARAA
jgi:putative transposase